MKLAHPDDIAAVKEVRAQAWQARAPYAFEARFRRHDGAWRWLRATCKPRESESGFTGYVGLAVDITESRAAEQALLELNQSLEARIDAAIAERERVEEALRQAQKMEAVGQLTGGIAHDFNNLLTVIGGNLDLAARRLGPSGDPAVLKAIGSAMTGADRAATLTQRLLAFSRRQPLAPRPIDPNALLAGMSDLLHRTLGETIEIETRLAAGLARIEVDPHQLESAILNLAVNARDAMTGGGRLVIETSAARLDDEQGADGERVTPGQYVAITVSDTGAGMNRDTLRRAVEPFFTTKEVGKGTGLGLSMVYGFVRQSGGQLRIESEEGAGTRVHIYLPRLAAEPVEEEQAEAAAAPRGGGDETILVCEDDDDVRAYTVELLAELGYRVLEAADGAATLRLLEDADARVDMLFTDVVLPGAMSGAELANRARELRPGLKVLYTTGYARDAIVHEGRLDPGIELVAKPFAFAELATRVREMLDRG
jgi:signal transduction histidine kinase/CheY-like chemotaxis protein